MSKSALILMPYESLLVCSTSFSPLSAFKTKLLGAISVLGRLDIGRCWMFRSKNLGWQLQGEASDFRWIPVFLTENVSCENFIGSDAFSSSFSWQKSDNEIRTLLFLSIFTSRGNGKCWEEMRSFVSKKNQEGEEGGSDPVDRRAVV